MKRLVCAAVTAALLMPGAWAVRARAQDDAASAPDQERAAPSGDSGQDASGKMNDRMKKRLELTDEQAGKLEDARKAHQEALKPLEQQLKDGFKKLGRQLKDKASDADIKASLDALKTAHKAMNEENEKFADGLASFLSPTQQAKLVIGMVMRMRRGRGGPPRGGRGRRGRGNDDDGQAPSAPNDGGSE